MRSNFCYKVIHRAEDSKIMSLSLIMIISLEQALSIDVQNVFFIFHQSCWNSMPCTIFYLNVLVVSIVVSMTYLLKWILLCLNFKLSTDIS